MRTLIVLASVLAVGLCMNKRQFGGLAGGWSDQDPTSQELLGILQNFTQSGLLRPATNDYTVTRIESQVVSGMNYRYTLQDLKGHSCHLTLYVQSWTNTMSVTHDECNLKVTSHKRAGGYSLQDASDQQYMTILQSFIDGGLLRQSLTNDYHIVQVESQVVAGMNYRYTLSNGNGHTCVLEVFVQSWTNTMSVTSDQCHVTVSKRQLLGGWQPVMDTNDTGLQACMGSMLDQVNMQSNSMYRLVESAVSAQYKVVQGTEYQIQLTAVDSTCMNSDSSAGLTSAKCAVNSASNMMGSQWSGNCWYRSWMTPALKLSNVHMMH